MIPETINGYRRTSKKTSDPVAARKFREDFEARGYLTMQKVYGSKIYLYIKDKEIKHGKGIQYDGPGSGDSV